MCCVPQQGISDAVESDDVSTLAGCERANNRVDQHFKTMSSFACLRCERAWMTTFLHISVAVAVVFIVVVVTNLGVLAIVLLMDECVSEQWW